MAEATTGDGYRLASDIRHGASVDRAYWSWVIESLCRQLELERGKVTEAWNEVQDLRRDAERRQELDDPLSPRT